MQNQHNKWLKLCQSLTLIFRHTVLHLLVTNTILCISCFLYSEGKSVPYNVNIVYYFSFSDIWLHLLTSLKCTVHRRALCWTEALCHLPNTGPKRLGRSEGRPIEGWFLRWECPALGKNVKSWGLMMIMTLTDRCRIKRHPAFPFFWRLWQRSPVLCSFGISSCRWGEKQKGVIHRANRASWCCLPWCKWFADFFLEWCLPLYWQYPGCAHWWQMSRRRHWIQSLRQAQRTTSTKSLKEKHKLVGWSNSSMQTLLPPSGFSETWRANTFEVYSYFKFNKMCGTLL